MPLDPLADNRNESSAPASSGSGTPETPAACIAPFPPWWPETVEEDDISDLESSTKEDPPAS